MLHQMTSPIDAHVGEVTTLVRSFADSIGECSGASSEDDYEMSKGRKRSYNCVKCNFFTHNPRAYLIHMRDVHFEKIRIYDCPYCGYATRRFQKLDRHINIIHTERNLSSVKESETQPSMPEKMEHNIEDLVEEIEDIEEVQNETEDGYNENILKSVGDDSNGNADSSKHGSNKYFSCSKCHYVTHVKARYKKHVKYHSMPMIKCTICDFRTPYKWNLDRHMKNHGGNGSFGCCMCNFAADIKQSLTVHEMNHHTSTAGHSSSRRRNRVGASDIMSMIEKEDEGSVDSRSSNSNSDMGLQPADVEMLTCSNEIDDVSDETGNKNGRQQESYEKKVAKQNKRPARPIPQLIPLNASTPVQSKTNNVGEPPTKKLKENAESNDNASLELTITTVNVSKEHSSRKKNESFFDKLKERILTETGKEGSLVCKNCGFESKCLSEHSVHENNCSTQSKGMASNHAHPLGSTRCQNCRHRCKSSVDLYNHLQTCRKSEIKNQEDDVLNKKSDSIADTKMQIQDKEAVPHPMENVVFVWNNINQEDNKFDTPLDININDDSCLPEVTRSYDSEIIDENDGMNLSPSNAVGKKVFKCPHCPFWATTASRFHVHIVGHLNKKPFECSLCKYKSNWRWDITKHIKLKSARDPEHNEAKVLMTDETGRRNYSKYHKYLAVSAQNENGETEFHYVDTTASNDAMVEVDESFADTSDARHSTENRPLNLQLEYKQDFLDKSNDGTRKTKKTLWKCKKCNYKDTSKDALLEHVREHSRPDGGHDDGKSNGNKPENTTDPVDLAYRCGHCNQLSNWKHVIQRHCRLKHDGVIKVITTLKPKTDASLGTNNDADADSCTKCPFKAEDKKSLFFHMQQHQPSQHSIFKCYFCPFFVKNEHELVQHLVLHGISDPEEYISKAMGCKSPLPEHITGPLSAYNISTTKRHKCTECPYETNSKSQFMYHEQFHRISADTPYKCPECNYSVSKRHLLHQHMRVHGITKKTDMDYELESPSSSYNTDVKVETTINLDEIPFVWVSAKNEFHKMYKCRYCSYVNSQKCKIPNHENIHFIVFENTDVRIYKCLECKFTCDNAGRLAEHSKSHGEIYGRIYCPVEDDIPDEEQILKLRKVIENEKCNLEETKDELASKDGEGSKLLHFCQKCPARFFSNNELKIHDKFHDSSFPIKCKLCEFSVSQENEMTNHIFVHTDEYQTKTKMLKFVHNSHPFHKEPRMESYQEPKTLEVTWTVTNPGKNYEPMDSNRKNDVKYNYKQYYCKECPAKFFKSSALSYHMGLHNGDGDHKCKKCSYSVKNSGNLAKHELLHENEGKNNCDYESSEDVDYKNIPLSGTDLFQRKTEAQKRSLNEKDKLVKPNDHFPPVLQADPQFGFLMHGNPEFIYPTYLKNGRQKEKRYKCHKCPSAFEKREQYKIHLSLHGSKQRYKCELCDYSVKYYANYVQHMRKHQMNDEAQAERKKINNSLSEFESQEIKEKDSPDNIKLAIKTMPKGAPKSDFQQFSISDQQTLRLLQRRRSINSHEKDAAPAEQSTSTKERKLHFCLLCPYTNQRRGAVDDHYSRHNENNVLNMGHHQCTYCGLFVVQSHFLRDHVKSHFNYQKSLKPVYFSANENVSFLITKIDSELSEPTDLRMDTTNIFNTNCNEDKIFVKINSGELLVE